MRIAFGTIPLGSAVDQRDSFALLDRFVDAGGTMLDTANNYPFWVEGCTGDESEATIGAWLAARGGAVRDKIFLGTKVGARPVTPGDRTLDHVEGLSAGTIRAGLEASLRRLRTDRVDLYWAHVEDRSVTLDETVGAFDGLVREGKVGAVGASNLPTWRLERARALAASSGRTPYTHVQLRHTYLRPRPGVTLPEGGHTLASDELLGYVREEGDLTLWAYNTLMFGAYTRADRPIGQIYDHPGTTARLAVLREVAAELGVTANQVVLAWLLADGVVPIVGVSTMAQLDEAIGAADVKLDADVLARLNAAV
ncbi:aldo/keto reductase [Luedemannella flava]|uniref:Aldo/keto reductase n=1 Tax=Luedemannella flava TaxID=349316 RepID=A0ABN2M856_9ACTN